MGSILDVLPHEGALFWGRTGALPLPDGRVLLVTPSSSITVEATAEPPDNSIPAPDEDLPVRRPRYRDAYPLFPGKPALSDPLTDFRRLWPRRHEPDDYVRQDPYTGGSIRVAQALRASPHGAALCYRLAVGDPRDPEVAYQLRQALQGMADAAAMFRMPFLAGDLRLDEGLGLRPRLEVVSHPNHAGVAPAEGQVVVHVGRMTEDMSSSLYLDSAETFPPPIDLVVEARLLEIMRRFGGTPLGRGGLLLTLAGCCARAGVGMRGSLPEAWRSLSPAAFLFGEAQSRCLVFLPPDRIPELEDMAQPLGLPVAVLGELGGPELSLDGVINLDVRELQ